jgi:hypothetical protein
VGGCEGGGVEGGVGVFGGGFGVLGDGWRVVGGDASVSDGGGLGDDALEAADPFALATEPSFCAPTKISEAGAGWVADSVLGEPDVLGWTAADEVTGLCPVDGRCAATRDVLAARPGG